MFIDDWVKLVNSQVANLGAQEAKYKGITGKALSIDDKVKNTLIRLWALGLDTDNSCQGHDPEMTTDGTKWYSAIPYMVFRWEEINGRTLGQMERILGHLTYVEHGLGISSFMQATVRLQSTGDIPDARFNHIAGSGNMKLITSLQKPNQFLKKGQVRMAIHLYGPARHVDRLWEYMPGYIDHLAVSEPYSYQFV